MNKFDKMLRKIIKEDICIGDDQNIPVSEKDIADIGNAMDAIKNRMLNQTLGLDHQTLDAAIERLQKAKIEYLRALKEVWDVTTLEIENDITPEDLKDIEIPADVDHTNDEIPGHHLEMRGKFIKPRKY